MATKNDYNYQSLDDFLKKDYDPQEIGRQLDETLSDLVHYASKEESYYQVLSQRHYILRELRNIFWNMNKRK